MSEAANEALSRAATAPDALAARLSAFVAADDVRTVAHQAHHAMARLLKTKLGEPTRAREHLEAALALVPTDTLALDVEALVRHLGLADFDLGGYSMGGRAAVRLLARGMRPRRAVVAGMGLVTVFALGALALVTRSTPLAARAADALAPEAAHAAMAEALRNAWKHPRGDQ